MYSISIKGEVINQPRKKTSEKMSLTFLFLVGFKVSNGKHHKVDPTMIVLQSLKQNQSKIQNQIGDFNHFTVEKVCLKLPVIFLWQASP